jgi:hypothetical protein
VRGRPSGPAGPRRRPANRGHSQQPRAAHRRGFLLTGYRDSATFIQLPLLLRLDSLLQPRWVALYYPPDFSPPIRQRMRYGGTCELTDGSLLVLAEEITPGRLGYSPGFALHRYDGPTGRLLNIYPINLTNACGAVHPYLLVPTADGRRLYVAGYCGGNPTRTGYVAVVDLQGLPGAVVTATRQPPARPPAPVFTLYPNRPAGRPHFAGSCRPGSGPPGCCCIPPWASGCGKWPCRPGPAARQR